MPYGVDYTDAELKLAKAIADQLITKGIFTVQGITMPYGVDYTDVEKRQAIAIADIFSSNKIGATQPWTKVTSIGSGWANIAGFAELAYTTEGNDLRIRGVLTGGMNGTLFTLPAGFRPSIADIIPIAANNGVGAASAYISITTSGIVAINTTGTSFVGIHARIPLS